MSPADRQSKRPKLLFLAAASLSKVELFEDIRPECDEYLQIGDALQIDHCAKQAPDQVVDKTSIDPVPIEVINNDIGEVVR